MVQGQKSVPDWTFLTNHAHVLLCLAKDPCARIRDIAAAVGITERAVQRIIAELDEAGYIDRSRKGRRNAYRIRGSLRLRHPIEQHRRIKDLIRLIHGNAESASARSKKAE